jgi:hypothetical protein
MIHKHERQTWYPDPVLELLAQKSSVTFTLPSSRRRAHAEVGGAGAGAGSEMDVNVETDHIKSVAEVEVDTN